MNTELKKNKAHDFLKEKNVNFNKPMGIYDVELHMTLFVEKLANETKTSNESGEICESELIVEHRDPEWDASMEDLKWKIHFGSKL